MNDSPQSNDALTGAWMMRILNDNFERMFLGSMSCARPASARVGWPRALGHKACRDNRSVLYQRVPTAVRGPRARPRRRSLCPPAQQTSAASSCSSSTTGALEPLDAAARHDLLEILEERYGRRSTIITSQLPVDKWHEMIGDPTYADAILDRLVHNAHRINSPATACDAHAPPSHPRIDRPVAECKKLSASEAPDPGRHHVGTPGDIISECSEF